MSSPPVSCASFDAALASLRGVRYRSAVQVDETPAPQRLAPYSVALSGSIADETDEVASGRLVLLHDPEGVDAWMGVFRAVMFVRASVEMDVAADPLLPGVGWAWLTESLHEARCEVAALGGTVTQVSSEGFGTLAAEPGQALARGHVEIRASWTPTQPAAQIGNSARAWACLLAQAAGLLPAPVAVTSDLVEH